MNLKILFRSLLGPPIAFQRCFVTITGSALDGLFLSQLFYWSDRLSDEKDGWFYKTSTEWLKETGMTRSEQETARRNLKAAGILEEKKEGLPYKLFYRLNWEILQSRLLETGKPGESELAFQTEEEKQSSIVEEITLERKTETGHVVELTKPLKPSLSKQALVAQEILEASQTEIPENLKTDAFLNAWADWCSWRARVATHGNGKGVKEPWTRKAAERALKKCRGWGPRVAVAAIENSVDRWQDIYKPDEEETNGHSSHFQPHRRVASL